jgi:hypothetical protein
MQVKEVGGLMKIRLVLLLVVASAMFAVAGTHAAKQPLTIDISTDKPTVKAGTSVWIKVHVTNTSKRELDFSATISNLTGADPNYLFSVRDEAGTAVATRAYEHPELATGSPVSRSLKPGESFTDDQDVSRVIDMRRPGQYAVQVSWTKDSVVKSNTITVTVTE